MGEFKPTLGVLISGVIILVVSLASVVLLTVYGLDDTHVYTLITSTIVPTFLTLFVLVKTDTLTQKTDVQSGNIHAIQRNVDGHLSALTTIIQTDKEGLGK